MSPPDPDRRTADEEEDADEAGPETLDLETLKLRADVPAILALAKAYRAGTPHVPRDMAKCLEAYRAAAELGSGEASYAVALFYLNGGLVGQDLKEAATHLRAAAERGSIPAKVYLGNLYELGIHYKADAEKADVWYRNAARGAKVDATPGTDEYAAALADLGCVRYVALLTKSDAIDETEKARLLARAKAHGQGLRIRNDDSIIPTTETDRATFVDALARAEGPAAMTGTPPPVAVDTNVRDRRPATNADAGAKAAPADVPTAKTRAKAKPASRNVSEGLAAFGYAILFVLAGIGAGYAAMVGAKELVAHGHALPGLGRNTRFVFPIVLALIGVLPSALVYRASAVAKALVAGGAFAGIGWVAWGTGQAALHPDRALQAMAFALAGFLATLLVLGLLGGTKAAKGRR